MTDITPEHVDEETDLDSLSHVDYVVVEFPAGASADPAVVSDEPAVRLSSTGHDE